MANQYILGENIDSIVDKFVASGQFQTREDVLKKGIALLQHQHKTIQEILAPSTADMKAGRVIPAEEVFARLEKKYTDMLADSK